LAPARRLSSRISSIATAVTMMTGVSSLARPDRLERSHAVHTRHADIHEHEVELGAFQGVEALLTVDGLDQIDVRISQKRPHQKAIHPRRPQHTEFVSATFSPPGLRPRDAAAFLRRR
jgi:hypothetical protein